MKTISSIIIAAIGLISSMPDLFAQQQADSAHTNRVSSVLSSPAGIQDAVAKDPALSTAVAYETLNVMRARAATVTNSPSATPEEIRKKTEAMLDELVRHLKAQQVNQTDISSTRPTALDGSERQTIKTPVYRSIEDRLSAIEARVSALEVKQIPTNR